MNESGSADRREFLRGAARYAALTGLTAMTAGLAVRGSRSMEDAERALPPVCRTCAKRGDCDWENQTCRRKVDKGEGHGRF